MKKTRRIAAMVAAMTLAACAAMPIMAFAEKVPISVYTNGDKPNEVTTETPDRDNAAHTYKVYEIFKGESVLIEGAETPDETADDKYQLKVKGLGSDANGLLEDSAFRAFRPNDESMTVGEAIDRLPQDATTAQKAIAAAQALASVTSGSPKAKELAEIIANVVTKTETAGTKIEDGTEIDDGYYLVTDTYSPKSDESTNDKPDAVSKFILRVNSAEDDSIEIIPKKSYPEVIKKVQEDDKDVAAYDPTPADGSLEAAVETGAGWNDVADYCIGQDVPFQLLGSMPGTLNDYSSYYYKFTDNLADSFDQPQEVIVTVGTETPKTLIFTLTDGAYTLADGYLQAADAREETRTSELFATPKFIEQMNDALEDTEGWSGMTEQAKLAYVKAHWTELTQAAVGDTPAGPLYAKGYKSTMNVDDIIVTKETVIPARAAVSADNTTDGNCRVKWDNGTLTVEFEDIKAYEGVDADTIIKVDYSARLNESAVIGLDGQENEVDLTYSNNPNIEYKPDTEDNTPNEPTDTDTTPKDKVIVFTYEVDINKIDADTKQNLAGAEFKLTDANGGVILFTDNGDGTYTVVDMAIPVSPIDEVKALKAAPAGQPVDTFKSDVDGMIKLIGLDDGTYYLEEITPPEGYTLPANPVFTLVVTANTINDQTWNGTPSTALTTNADWKDAEGNPYTAAIKGTLNGELMDVLTAGTVTPLDNERGANGGVFGIIENTKTTPLPSTGGIGTKLFVVGGGLAAAMAGVYLVSKKKAKDETAE